MRPLRRLWTEILTIKAIALFLFDAGFQALQRAFDQTPTTPVDRDINDQSFSENVKYLANQKALQNELSIRPLRRLWTEILTIKVFGKCEISREKSYPSKRAFDQTPTTPVDRDINDQSFSENVKYLANQKARLLRFFVRRGLSSPSKRAFDQTPTTPKTSFRSDPYDACGPRY
ncbi:hypothetical protein PUN28_012724 [Cardiocondyla obscurior]|uniref:Uncharacterized protein n=1 Tax=Cardiocondyla obscurior TaxID=286306 RepID=A0AAW2FFF4_9HYME